MKTVDMPSTSANAFTISGSATSDGALSRSSDGRFLVFGGYNVAAGTASVTSGSDARRIALLKTDGTYTIAPVSFDTLNANNMRSAATADGSELWAGGAKGVAYGAVPPTGSAVGTSIGSNNARVLQIFDGKLYMSSSAAISYYSGLPKVSETPTAIPSLSGSSIYGFSALDLDSTPGVDTLYYIDSNNGLHKWSLTDGKAVAFTSPTEVNSGGTGLDAVVDRTNPSHPVVNLLISVTTATTSAIYLVKDDGSGPDAGTPSVVKLVDAAQNTVYRGVTFSPN